MNRDTIQLVLTYGIAGLILVGAFVIIRDMSVAAGDKTQVWLLVGLVGGYIFRDAGGAAATRSVERIAASQPTVTVDPPRTTVKPAEDK